MKFLRENILKIFVVFGVLILVIIFLIACSGKGGSGGKASSYDKMEDNLKADATRYLSKHKDLLPKTEGKITKIEMDTIYNEKQMKKMTAIDDETVRCSGYVNVSYRVNTAEEKVYRVVPHVKCGDKYETEDLYVHILKNEDLVQEYDGLYKVDKNYIFRGENPNNYLKIGENLYRIMSIDSDGYIKIINAKSSKLSSVWDDRYNVDTGKYNGINDYYVSRVRQSLNEYFATGEFITDLERDIFVKHDYCIGKRSETNVTISKDEECSNTSDEDYLSLPILYDYYIASVDSNCKSILDEACNNYNYLQSLRTFYTSTGSKETSSLVFSVSETAGLSRADRTRKIPTVAFIANVSYTSGKGTLENPYIVK